MSGNFLGFNIEGRGKGAWDACCLAPDGEHIGQPHAPWWHSGRNLALGES